MDVPSGLGETGSAIYLSKAAGVVDPAALALIKEAARCADRLDELDNIIQGKGVLNLMRFRMPHGDWDNSEVTVEVKFDHVLAEARQQQQRLTSLLQSVNAITPAVAPALPAEEKPAEPTGFSNELDERRARRAAARAK